jgi:hypothetical protein
MNDFIKNWCDERHTAIDREFKAVWKQIDKLQGMLWGVLIMLFMNLAGIVTILVR